MRPTLRPALALLVLAPAAAACGGAQTPCEPCVTAQVIDVAEPTRDESETLLLDGTPEVPPELVAALRPYLNTRSAGLGAIAGDGTSMLITTRFGEISQVHRVDAPGGARTQLTFLDERATSPSYVTDDPDAMLYMADAGGDEQARIWRMNLATGVATTITPEGKTGSYVWSNAGDRIAFNGNYRNGADMDVWVSDADTADTAELVAEFDGYWYALDWSPDDSTLLVGNYVSITESSVFTVDIASGEMTRVSPEEPAAAWLDAAFGPDGRSVYVASDTGGDFRSLYRVDLDSGAVEPLTADIPWNVEALAMNGDRSTLAVSMNEGGISRVYLLDTTTGDRTLAPLPDGIIYGMDWADEDDVLAFGFSSSTSNGDVYTWAPGTDVTRWTFSELGGLDPSRLREPELRSFASFDGLDVPYFRYVPAGDGPFPVMINIHGGPESQARPWFSSLTQFLLAEMGVAVLVPNVRGSDGYGREYLTLDNGMLREDSVRDIGALLDVIADDPQLDASRVAVFGGSYGGYMVLASLMHYGDRLSAGIDMVGISNFVTFLENTSEYRRDLRRAEYGDERDPEMRAHLLAISPTENVDRITTPLFVAQGANDPRVPASEAEQIVEAVRNNGRDVWYMLAYNEGHGFARRENSDLFLQLTVLFLREHLGL